MFIDYGDSNFSPAGDTTAVVTTLQQTLETGGRQHKTGVWVPQITYFRGDFVYFHDGTVAGIYSSLVDDNKGVSPQNQTNWRLLFSCDGSGGIGGTGGITGISINGAGNYTNIAFGNGFTVTGNSITFSGAGSGTIGDMLKSQYDSDNDGKVNTAHVADQVQWSGVLNKPPFAIVATTGSYNDLTDKPVIPAAQVNSDWVATSGVSMILNKPTVFPPADHTHSIYLTEAPLDGDYYTRRNGTWTPVPSATGSGLKISSDTVPGTTLYDEIIFDPNFVVNGNVISLFQNGNIICGVNPNIKSTSTNPGIPANSGTVASAHSMNDQDILTLHPEYLYGNIFQIVGARPVTGAESTANFISGYFDASTSDTLNRERIWGILSDISVESGWDATNGIALGADIVVHNKTGADSTKISGIRTLFNDATNNVGYAYGISSAQTGFGFQTGLEIDGIHGTNSSLIKATAVNNAPATGIDFSAVNFVSGALLKGNCITISQDGVFDTPCTNKAIFNQGVDVIGDLTVSKIVFGDATEMTTAAVVGASPYWISPYVGIDVPGTGLNILTDGQSRVWHSPSGSYIINRKENTYYGVQLTVM